MTALDLEAISAEFLNQCGSCDAGVSVICTCAGLDHRSTMLALVREVERLRARRGYASVRLEKSRQAAEELLRKEQQHSGTGREGHLSEDDLVPLFEALGVVYLDDPNAKLFVGDEA
jgi:hypothetical protein